MHKIYFSCARKLLLTFIIFISNNSLAMECSTHNFTKLNKEELATTLKDMGIDQKFTEWIYQKKISTDKWICEHIDYPTWNSGYPHNFIDKYGSRMRWSINDKKIESDIIAGNKSDEAWVAISREKNSQAMVDASYIYKITKSKIYSDWIISQIDYYSNNYSGWSEKKNFGRSRLMYQPLDEAVFIIALLDAERNISENISADKKNEWSDKLLMPIFESLDDSFNGLNNVSIWQRAAMLSIAEYKGDYRMASRALDGNHGLVNIIKWGVSNDGIWKEGSFAYQYYTVIASLKIFPILERMNLISDYKNLIGSIKSIAFKPLQLSFSDGYLPSAGDSTSRVRAINLEIHCNPIWGETYAPISCNEYNDWAKILTGIDSNHPHGKPLEVNSNLMPESNMALIKTNSWQIFFYFGQSTKNHGQFEALSFQGENHGVKVFIDEGTVMYGSELHNKYFKMPAGNNSIIIDGRGQEILEAGNLIYFNDASVKASNFGYHERNGAYRHLKIDQDSLVDQVSRDSTTASDKESTGLIYHLACKVSTEEYQEVDGKNLPSGIGLEYWRGLRRKIYTQGESIKLNCSNHLYEIHLYTDAKNKLEVYWGATPPGNYSHTTSTGEGVFILSTGNSSNITTITTPIANIKNKNQTR